MIECIYFLSQIQNGIVHMHSAAVRIFTPIYFYETTDTTVLFGICIMHM